MNNYNADNCFGCGKKVNGTNEFWHHARGIDNYYFCSVECIMKNPFRSDLR